MKNHFASWTNTVLGEVCSFKSGSGFKENYQGMRAGEHPFIKVSDLTLPGNEKYITDAQNWISGKALKELRAKLQPARATVFAKVGAALKLNRRRILTRPTAIDNNMMAAIPDETKLNNEFLYFFLLTQDLGRFSQEGAVPSVNQQHLAEINIGLPPLLEQCKIAKILSTWDKAIETVEKLIAGSQAQTKALIQQLLKQNRRLQGFEGNWNTITLGQICQITTGQPAPKNSNDFSTRGIPFLRVSALESLLAGSSEDDFEKISSKTAEHYRLSLFPEGTVIFAKSGMSSKLGRVYQLRKSCYLVSHYAAVLPNSETSSDFLVCWLETNPPSSLIQGEGFPSIKISEIKKMKLKLTSLAEQKAIVSVINCAKAEVQVWTRELKHLSDQKKVLMQQILTGKRRVVKGNTNE